MYKKEYKALLVFLKVFLCFSFLFDFLVNIKFSKYVHNHVVISSQKVFALQPVNYNASIIVVVMGMNIARKYS